MSQVVTTQKVDAPDHPRDDPKREARSNGAERWKPEVPIERRVTVSVVDDDAEVRDQLGALLNAGGVAVATYPDAGRLLQAHSPFQPGCLLIDARLGGMSGLELLKELRARKVSAPVIVTLSQPDVMLAVEAMRLGAFDVLVKPFDEDQVLTRVRAALAEDRQARHSHAMAEEVRLRYARLTPREREVADLVVAGLPSRAIAAMLAVGEKTIDVYRSRVKSKMKARNSADLARLLQAVQG